MTRSSRLAIALAALSVTAATGAASASAAPFLRVGAKCVTYGSIFAGEKYIPAGGGGWLPAVPVELRYSSGDVAGTGTPEADGTFVTRVFAPTDFIALKRHFKNYTLRATQGTATASVGLTMVRADVALPAKASPHARVTFRIYGFPRGKNVFAHYVFGGKRRVRTYMGKASRTCGTLTKRQQYLPARTRYGTWTIYFTNTRALPKNRRKAIYYYRFTVRRVIRFRRLLGGHAAGASPTAVAEAVR
jgi:hypothetical protein